MDYIKSDKYLVSSDGQIRFTEQGIRDLGDYFSRAGISIHTIKTYKEYREARALAAPYFTRPIRCSRMAGFQGRSTLMTVLAACRLSPWEPALDMMMALHSGFV